MKKTFKINGEGFPKAAIWLLILLLFYKRIKSALKTLFAALGITRTNEQKYDSLLDTLSDQAIIDTAVSAIQVNKDKLNADIDVLGYAFGWKYSDGSWLGSWNPYSWTEDETSILNTLKKYDSSSVKYLDKLYNQRWDRESLKADCLVYLSTSQYEQIQHLWT